MGVFLSTIRALLSFMTLKRVAACKKAQLNAGMSCYFPVDADCGIKIECCLQKRRLDLFLIQFTTEYIYISIRYLSEETNTVPKTYDRKFCTFAGGREDTSCTEPGASWEVSGACAVVEMNELRGVERRDRGFGVQ